MARIALLIIVVCALVGAVVSFRQPKVVARFTCAKRAIPKGSIITAADLTIKEMHEGEQCPLPPRALSDRDISKALGKKLECEGCIPGTILSDGILCDPPEQKAPEHKDPAPVSAHSSITIGKVGVGPTTPLIGFPVASPIDSMPKHIPLIKTRAEQTQDAANGNEY